MGGREGGKFKHTRGFLHHAVQELAKERDECCVNMMLKNCVLCCRKKNTKFQHDSQNMGYSIEPIPARCDNLVALHLKLQIHIHKMNQHELNVVYSTELIGKT